MSATATAVACPKCGGPTWDNRVGKKNPKAPDFKCRDKSCDGVIWPPKNGARQAAPTPEPWEQEQAAAEQSFVQSAKAQTHGELVTQKLNDLMQGYDLCFTHALSLAKRASGPDTVVTLEGVSAIAATLFIAAKDKGLV